MMAECPHYGPYDERFLEPSPYGSDGGHIIGKTPRRIPTEDLRDLGHPTSPMKAIRANCLQCVGTESEVRKCVQTSCPLWPLRMGTNPFHGLSRNNAENNEKETE